MIEKFLKSLLDAEAYPEPTVAVRLMETHVSFIFVTDRFVYKVKKPVNFGFLDFTTLDRRRFYCGEEVRLNSRLCPDLYLGVVEVRQTPEGAGFYGSGTVIDYAVKMNRLPEDRMLDRLLAEGKVGVDEMVQIAEVIAPFHLKARRAAEIDACGDAAVISGNWRENFRQAAHFIGTTITSAEFAELKQWVERFFEENGELFRARIAGGFIRECDGDLHSGNICLADRVCIFDCIEFNDRFRYIDTAADLSFLLMDLEYSGRPDLSAALLERYRELTGDPGTGALLDFYKMYRAFVRGKVITLRLGEPGLPQAEHDELAQRARRYFRLARGYTFREQLVPALVITCGVTGSGKSTLARALARELGLEIRRSDVVRKELAAPEAVETSRQEGRPYRGGIYTEDMDRATYATLLAAAERELSGGRGIVIDATFRRAADREPFRELAERLRAKFFIVETHCPEESARQRLEARLDDPQEVSDGRWEHYHRQLAEFEPPAAGESIRVLTTLPVEAEVDQVLKEMGLTA